jgi:hypothetical protein
MHSQNRGSQLNYYVSITVKLLVFIGISVMHAFLRIDNTGAKIMDVFGHIAGLGFF